jgi:uncharacterized phage infection (PIP) family protein YhgE
MSLSGSTTISSAIERMADSHSSIASSVEKQTRIQQLKEQMSALQIEFTMHKDLGDLDAARPCITQMPHLRTPLDAIPTMAKASSFTEEDPRFEKVELTNEEDDDKEPQ